MATPEGVVRDSSDGEDGNVNDDTSSDEDDQGLDPLEQARRAAKRHCGWVPSSSNGVEVRRVYCCMYAWCLVPRWSALGLLAMMPCAATFFYRH